ncbi:hypothetical protein D3C77_592750 [compost metagenome]
MISLVGHRSSDHQHHLTAHDVEGEGQDERLRQHPEYADQAYDLCGMQGPRLTQVLHHQHGEGDEEHRIGQLDQAHPLTVQGRPANLGQPPQQCLGKTLLQAQGNTADSQ